MHAVEDNVSGAIETVRDRVGYPDTRMGKIKALGQLTRDGVKTAKSRIADMLEEGIEKSFDD